jgi:hypothetical protein
MSQAVRDIELLRNLPVEVCDSWFKYESKKTESNGVCSFMNATLLQKVGKFEEKSTFARISVQMPDGRLFYHSKGKEPADLITQAYVGNVGGVRGHWQTVIFQ